MNGIDDEEEIAQDELEPGIPIEEQSQVEQVPVRPPIVAPQAQPMVMQGPIAAPGSAPIAAPANPNLVPLTDQQAQERANIRRLQYQLADVPYKEAADAVNAALRFQSQRGYQQDLANGVPAAEALAKWAPTMFGPKGGSVSGAAALIRATRPPADRVINAGGQLFRYDPAAKAAVPLTQPKVTAPKTSVYDAQYHSSLLQNINRLENQLAAPEGSISDYQKTDLRRRLVPMYEEERQIRARGSAPSASPAAKGRVRVKSPDGKTGSIPADQLEAALAAGYTKM
jgi:hypothetical protein